MLAHVGEEGLSFLLCSAHSEMWVVCLTADSAHTHGLTGPMAGIVDNGQA